MFEEQSQDMSEEKIKKKLNCQIFFLVGPDSSTSEDSSTIEYSAIAPTGKTQTQTMGGARMSRPCLLRCTYHIHNLCQYHLKCNIEGKRRVLDWSHFVGVICLDLSVQSLFLTENTGHICKESRQTRLLVLSCLKEIKQIPSHSILSVLVAMQVPSLICFILFHSLMISIEIQSW